MRVPLLSLALCAALGAPSLALAEDLTQIPGESTALPEEPEPGTRKGLMIAGWAVTGGTWAFTGLVGLTMIQVGLEADSNPYEECLNCYSAGSRLLVPIAGPFMAIPVADGTDGKVVCFVLGAAQLTGLGLGIGGTARYRKDKEAWRTWKEGQAAVADWQLTPTVAVLGADEAPMPALHLVARF